MRLLTALSILCICAITSFWGWNATTFAEARGLVIQGESTGVDLTPWVSVPGLTAEALQTSLRYGPPTALSRKYVELTSLLSIRPMSAEEWLSLAGNRLGLGQSPDDVNAALAMSWITGPNEGEVMLQRGTFGLVRWEVLPADARRQVAADLAGAMDGDAFNRLGISLAKNIVKQKSPEMQAEIAAALGIAGISAPKLSMIGLRAD